MRASVVYWTIGLCLVAYLSNQAGAERSQYDYIGPSFEVNRSRVQYPVIKWLAELLEKSQSNGQNVIRDLNKILADPEKTDKDARRIIRRAYRKDYAGPIKHLRGLVEGLTLDKLLQRLRARDWDACVPIEYRFVLNVISWMYSLDDNQGNSGDLIVLSSLKPPQNYTKLFAIITDLANEIMTICSGNIRNAYNTYLTSDRWFESNMDDLLEIYAVTSTASLPDRDELLYELAIETQQLNGDFVASIVVNACREEDTRIGKVYRSGSEITELTRKTADHIKRVCANLIRGLFLSVETYDLAMGVNPELVQPLEDLATNKTFMKLREYTRFCNKLEY